MMLIAYIAIALGNICFVRKRLLRYLRFFQQEEYSGKRFFRFLVTKRAWDRRGSLICCVAALLTWVAALWSPLLVFLLSGVAAALLLLIARMEENPLRHGKITLKMTPRASRLARLAFLLYASTLCGTAALTPFWGAYVFWLCQMVLIQATPLWLLLAKRLLDPSEKKVQRILLEEAQQKLAEMNPLIVGVTGSYGKTSSKAILGAILDRALGPTFWTSRGINTKMGLTREVRERLHTGQKYAVIEMGAYQKGSIQGLCELFPPRAGITTAVGLMHLNRFGSAKAIFEGKAELARAIPHEGILVCNGDDPGARRIAETYPKQTTLLYGLDSEGLACRISDLEPTLKGTLFTLHWQGKAYKGFTPLLGPAALSNLAGAFTMACALGCDPDYVLAVTADLEPVDNRLRLTKREEIYHLMDGYNSNPRGFKSALDVLQKLPATRKILMTPGMIELGPRQPEENRLIAAQAAAVCDLVLVVGPTNRKALIEGLIQGGMNQQKIIACAHREEAFKYLADIRREGDMILIENDLPDLFENVEAF